MSENQTQKITLHQVADQAQGEMFGLLHKTLESSYTNKTDQLRDVIRAGDIAQAALKIIEAAELL